MTSWLTTTRTPSRLTSWPRRCGRPGYRSRAGPLRRPRTPRPMAVRPQTVPGTTVVPVRARMPQSPRRRLLCPRTASGQHGTPPRSPSAGQCQPRSRPRQATGRHVILASHCRAMRRLRTDRPQPGLIPDRRSTGPCSVPRPLPRRPPEARRPPCHPARGRRPRQCQRQRSRGRQPSLRPRRRHPPRGPSCARAGTRRSRLPPGGQPPALAAQKRRLARPQDWTGACRRRCRPSGRRGKPT
jgi:hypothetical protein